MAVVDVSCKWRELGRRRAGLSYSERGGSYLLSMYVGTSGWRDVWDPFVPMAKYLKCSFRSLSICSGLAPFHHDASLIPQTSTRCESELLHVGSMINR